jgi:uncharacterized protein YfdQ (DUF2303 family)
MEAQTLQQLQQLIISAAGLDPDHQVGVLPEGMKIVSLEPYMVHRNQFRGTMTTQSFDDFIRYCTDLEAEECYIYAECMSAKAFFDIGNRANPGHCHHKAKLKLQSTAPYDALIQAGRESFDQREMAEWIEEWSPHLTILDGLGEDASVIANHTAIAAVRTVTIATSAENESTQEDFKASRSSFAQVEARTRGATPSVFRFRCEPYHGLESREFSVRLSIMFRDDKPVFKLRLIQLEAAKEAMAEEFKEKLVAAFEETAVTTYIGEFSA